MSITLCHRWRLVAQESLDLVQVLPGLDESCRERMSKIVEAEIHDLGCSHRTPERSIHIALVQHRPGLAWEDKISSPGVEFLLKHIDNPKVQGDRPLLTVF